MCVTFVAFFDSETEDHESASPHSRYKVILVNTRDEDFSRPTSPLSWKDDLMAGWDDQVGGLSTWLAVSASGNIGNVLAIEEPPSIMQTKRPRSRGYIPTDYLQSKSLSTYCASLSNSSDLYRGFQFVGLERCSRKNYRMVSLVNRLENSRAIKYYPPGCYGFGNSPYDIPFLKVQRGEEKFRSIIQKHMNSDMGEIIPELLNFVQDPTPYFPDSQLKSQTLALCKAEDDYKYLSSLFVRNKIDKEYGSRSHSVILIDRNDHVMFHEKRLADEPHFDGQNENWESSTISFSIA
ncbi:transport and golgi organization 2 domain-containing protein [Ditylenchus destructor]|uniref:Transport and golgi organization 2 domain-containing protein n=1 Tax=Ditylenchus destructor TaxID=166010 RepID=A0AAD4MSP7_9BILA|nr:transport and golgi organization 2 domain-containing protein [Ditylenchus destructor]